MRGIDATTWTRLSPLLDEALDLSAAEREPFLRRVHREQPGLAALLARLLASHDQAVASAFLAEPLEPQSGLAGSQVGAYLLERPLGAGGMGSVWLGRRQDGRFEGRAAIKLLHLDGLPQVGRTRVRREATALARLSHPHIAPLLDAGVTSAGQPYLVLEYVEGEPIDRHADTRRLDVAGRLQLFLQVADAVAHAHAHLVVHRDIKPSNILVDDAGRARLLDFGIATLLADDAEDAGLAPSVTARALTPAFAAPEQVSGGAVTVATDVFALGTLLYLLLTGRHPAEPALDSPAALLRAITDVEPPPMAVRAVAADPALTGTPMAIAEARRTTPARLAAALHGDLDTIVATALKKAPGERYASVDALAADVRRHLRHEPIAAHADSRAYRMRRFVRRHRLAVALGSVAAAAVLAAAVGLWVQGRQSAADRDFALQQLARAEAANDMNAFLLSDAAPLGGSFTAGELLRRAEDLLSRHPTDPPDAPTVDSLVAIGAQFQAQDEDANARRVLTRAFELARALPGPAVTTRARAGCTLAPTLARGSVEDKQRAQALIAESMALVPAGRPFALDRVHCERMAATVARLTGDGAADVAHAREAQRLLLASGLASPLALLQVEMDLAEAYRASGRSVEAETAFRAAWERMRGLGRERTERAGTLLNDWGLLLMFLGRPRDAEVAFRQAVEISQTDAAGASVSPMLLLNAARPVLELGREDEAIAMIERARTEATRAGDEVVDTQALLLEAGAYRQRGDLDRAAALFDEAEARLRQALPPGHGAFASLTLQRANIALARGQLDEARTLTTDALARAEAASQGGDLISAALLRRAQIALAAGATAEAREDARRALDAELRRTPAGQQSSRLGRVYLTVGEAARAAGDEAGGRAALAEAAAHLDATLGPDHRDARRAHDLLRPAP
jgi:serine/threonine protein kinase